MQMVRIRRPMKQINQIPIRITQRCLKEKTARKVSTNCISIPLQIYSRTNTPTAFPNTTTIQSQSPATTTDSAKQFNQPVFGPSLLLSNTMSLAPKIDEIILCVTERKPDLACSTETWLHDAISEDCINIPGYNLIYKNRTSGVHGGVCTYIRNSIKFKTLNHLHHPDFEVLWAHIKPKRLPRGIPCIVIGTVYHPPSGDDNSMIDYLSLTLTSIEDITRLWNIPDW